MVSYPFSQAPSWSLVVGPISLDFLLSINEKQWRTNTVNKGGIGFLFSRCFFVQNVDVCSDDLFKTFMLCDVLCLFFWCVDVCGDGL